MANIVNITATFTIRGPILMPKSAKYKYYLSKKSQKMIEFPGAIYKKFGHTFILYKSGKVVCVGGKKIDILQNICTKIAKILCGLSRIYDFKIKNLVACRSLGNFLDLNLTAESIKSKKIRICYDPELFASLLVYTENCLVMLFHTGKVIFTGAQTEKDINEAWELTKHQLIWK